MSVKYEFGEFTLDAQRRLLERQGQLVPLKNKAFDLLCVLVESNGMALAKGALYDAVWPGQVVEESNLTVHISALRRALGEKRGEHRYIVTLPGHGYKFVAEVTVSDKLQFVAAPPEIQTEVADAPQEMSTEAITPAEVLETPLLAAPERRRQTKVRRTFGIFLVAAILLTGIGLWWQRGRRSVPFQPATVKRLTNNGNVVRATLSPDGKMFAYAKLEKDNKYSLWMGNVNGGNHLQLRPAERTRYANLAFTPDSSSLYYVAEDVLYRISALGGEPEKLRDKTEGAIAFAPDGRRFASVRVRREIQQVVLVLEDVASREMRDVVVVPYPKPLARGSVAWSPDGETIALGAANSESGGNFDLYLVRVADGQMQPLTQQSWSSILGTAWLPDGDGLIVAAAARNAGEAAQLWHVSYPDGATQLLVSDLNQYDLAASLAASVDSLLVVQAQGQSNLWVAPASELSRAEQITFDSPGRRNGWYGVEWTPDDKLLYTAFENTQVGLWSAADGGQNPRQVVPPDAVSVYPSLSDDGRVMVFQSNRGGATEVWRADPDGSNARALTSGGRNAQPSISPDGQWAVYVSVRNGIAVLTRVSLAGGPPQQLAERSMSWPRYSPDGQTIACGYDDNGAQKLATIPATGGKPLQLFDIPSSANFRYGIRWTPDGQAITYRDWADGIWRQPIAGGPPQRLAGLPKEKLYCYAWSRDGKRFAYARGTEIRDVVLLKR